MRGLSRQFSTGWFDYFFGRRAVATTLGKDGRQHTVVVTERWLRRREDEGNIDPIDLQLVPVHLLGLGGYELTSWVIGEDVEEEAWRRFRDPTTGHLMAMSVLRNGREETFLMERTEWLRLKRELDSVEKHPDEERSDTTE